MSAITGTRPTDGASAGSRPTLGVVLLIDESDVVFDIRIRVSTNPDPTVSPFWDIAETRSFPFGGSIYTATELFTPPDGTSLAPGTWYMRIDVTYTGTSSNIVGSPIVTDFSASTTPGVVQVSPESGKYFSHTPATSYPLAFTWTYSLSDDADYQTAYQVLVTKVSDGSTVVDTGKVTSGASGTSIAIPAANKEQELQWKVRAWNRYDSVSNYTGNRNFWVATPPAVTITSPTEGATLNNGNPSVTLSLDTSGGRTVNRIVVELYEGTKRIWTKTTLGTWADNTTGLVITDTNFFLTHGTTYRYRVWASDNQNLLSSVVSRNVTIEYTPPSNPGAITVSDASYDSAGYVSVQWPDTGRDLTNFYAWEIQREDSLIDPDTGAVITTDDWKSIGAIYSPEVDGYEFLDYLAPSNYQVRYRVRQIIFTFNTMVPGDYSTSGTAVPVTTAYWLISGINGFNSVLWYKFHNVNADSYTHETEEAEYPLIGRGRYVETGTEFGKKGTLECQLRNSGGTTARFKRLTLEEFKRLAGKATLRNPFGDEYYVSVGNITVSRIAGTGASEFSDVTIPYAEIVSQ